MLEDLASDFIKATPADQPFFVMFSPTTPHLPADDPRYATMPVSPTARAGVRREHHDAGDARCTRAGPRSRRKRSRRPTSTTRRWPTPRARSTTRSAALLGSLGDRAQDTIVIYHLRQRLPLRRASPDREERSVGGVRQGTHGRPVPRRACRRTARSRATRSSRTWTWRATIFDAAGCPVGRRRPVVPAGPRAEEAHRPNGRAHRALPGRVPWHPGLLGLLDFNGARVMTPGFQGVITERYKYVEFDDGSRQLIDLKKDPLRVPRSLEEPAEAPTCDGRWQSKLRALLRAAAADHDRDRSQRGGHVEGRRVLVLLSVPVRDVSVPPRPRRQGRAPWRSCPGGFAAFSGLADGDYRFEVAGISESGRVDPTPAVRRFTLTATGPDVSLSTHPGASGASRDATFTYHSASASVAFQCRLVPEGDVVPWAPCAASGAVLCRARRWQLSVRCPGARLERRDQPAFRRMVLPRGQHRSDRRVLHRAGRQHAPGLRGLPLRGARVDRRFNDLLGRRKGRRLFRRPVSACRACARAITR